MHLDVWDCNRSVSNIAPSLTYLNIDYKIKSKEKIK